MGTLNKAISYSKSRVPADVEIEIFDKTYHLHSAILRQFSGFFDASLSETWWKAENDIHGHPQRDIRYHYQLCPDETRDLMLMPVGMEGAAHNASGFEVPSTPETQEELDLAKAYETLFRIFYHIPWDPKEPRSVKKCVSVATLADQYLSLSVVAGTLENRLLTAPFICEMISYQGPVILVLALKIRSGDLFHDAFIHVVGQWKVLRKQEGIDKDWPDGLRAMVEREYMRICELAIQTERGVLAHIAQNFSNAEFRTWQIRFDLHTHSLDLNEEGFTALWYRKLSAGTSGAEEILEPLLKNNLVLGPQLNFRHLTCAEVGREDYPWDNDEESWSRF